MRNNEIDSTAIGIDAETVIPTLSTRYIDDAAVASLSCQTSSTRKFKPALPCPLLGGDHVGVGYAFGAARNDEIALRAEHFSNAGIKHPNPGQNFLELRYTHYFR